MGKSLLWEKDNERVLSRAGRGETFAAVLSRRLSRRGVLQTGVGAAAVVLAGPVVGAAAQATPSASPSATGALNFEPVIADAGPDLIVAAGHSATPFLSWGDALFSDLAEFDAATLTAEEQARRIGYNHDFVGFLPLPIGADMSDHGLLVINHEYTNPELMFPDYLAPNPLFGTPVAEGEDEIPEFVPAPTNANIDVELEAHGVTVAEILRNGSGAWELVLDSPYNRRITATTEMEITGPAAGSEMMKTGDDPDGKTVIGTLNNCSGGLTPWGTYISCEENFNQYFANVGSLPEDSLYADLHDRMGLPAEGSERLWEGYLERFDVSKSPNEPFRFGWAVEFDPHDATSTPKKRTSLGRFKHEAVNLVVTPDNKVVVYAGDDERFEYVYKFVAANAFNPDDRAANMDLLDEGTLYVAKYNDDGTGEWLPMVQGEGDLTEANGFPSQAEVLINARGAADLLGATKMDRPEDMEHSPVNGKVYVVLTNNTQRGTDDYEGATASNPRDENKFGHIVEMTEDGDHAALTFAWDIFLLAGDPTDESTYFAGFPKDKISKMANPDNITFDMDGNLWISTDGQPGTLEVNDGLFAVPVDGSDRGYLRQFFSAVTGAEVSGPIFTPDNSTLFLSVQHPGEGSTFSEPSTSWPGTAGPPRPSLVVIQAESGDRVGAGS